MLDAAHVPLILELIIALVVAEMVALALLRLVKGRGLTYADNIGFLGAGLFMMIALFAIATGAPFALFAIGMLVSLVLHVIHIVQRWKS